MVIPGRWSSLAKRLLFAAALLATAYVREGDGRTVDQAVIWFPSGVAVAGLWLLGVREWWVVGLCTVAQRLRIGYDMGVASSAAVGSVAEALLGARTDEEERGHRPNHIHPRGRVRYGTQDALRQLVSQGVWSAWGGAVENRRETRLRRGPRRTRMRADVASSAPRAPLRLSIRAVVL